MEPSRTRTPVIDRDTLLTDYSDEYHDGWNYGLDGRPTSECPHQEGSNERLSWMLGHSVGETRREVIRSRRYK